MLLGTGHVETTEIQRKKSGGTVMHYHIEDEEKLLTMNEAREYLRVSRSTMHRLINSGQLVGRRVSRTWRFQLKDLRKLVGIEVSA